MGERGVPADHSTIHRWFKKYASELKSGDASTGGVRNRRRVSETVAAKSGGSGLLRTIAESVLQLIMEADINGMTAKDVAKRASMVQRLPRPFARQPGSAR